MKNLIIGLFLIVISFFAASGCQTPSALSKGGVVNKTHHNFLGEAGVDEKTNPHNDGKCQVCHSAPNDILTKEKAVGTELFQRKQMRTDLIDLCAQCHKERLESEHSIGVPTKLNRENLPLDHDGKITCATTCHDMHSKEKSKIRLPFDTLCLSCHDV